MFGSNLIARINLPKSACGDRRFSLLSCKCLRFKQTKTARFSSFQCELLKNKSFKQLTLNRLRDPVKWTVYRCNTVQASFAPKKENDQLSKSHFQELMNSRKDQANRSVLLHVSTKDDIPYALAKCEEFGVLTNVYSYPGEGNNCFVLVEFLNKIATEDLLKACQYHPMNDIFPVFSRIIQFEKKSKSSVPTVNIEIHEKENIERHLKGYSVSEIIENIYSTEKLTELDTRLRYFFCILVKDSASSVFPYCDVFPFGSSVNGIGRRGCDLDLMIRVYSNSDTTLNDYPEKKGDGELIFFNKTCIGHKAMQQKVVNFLGVYFQTFLPGITSVQRILHARIPIMKMDHRLLKMDCDVSVNNMSAVYMSDVVHFCGEVDQRFRPLLYAVKKWAKEAYITNESPGSWITNFGLTNLLIYFFQMERILPCLNDALVILGEDNCPNFHLQYFKPIDEWRNLAARNKKSLADLFVEFLSFLAKYKFDENILSLMTGKPRPHTQLGVPLWVQYPFDEDLNVTKNVSEYEFAELQNKAALSAKSLENEMKKKTNITKDFSVLLAIPSFKKPKKTVDVAAYFKDHKPNPAKFRRS